MDKTASLSRHRVESWPADGLARLSPKETRHIERALRLGPGDAVELFDGTGFSTVAILETHPEGGLAARLRESPRCVSAAGPRFGVVLALIKGDRLAWTVEKLTEIGAANIVLFPATRSVRRPGEGLSARLASVTEAAAKQCGRADLPVLYLAADLQEAVSRSENGGFYLEPTAEPPLCAPSEPFPLINNLAIGPEGGWTADEIQYFTEFGWFPRSMGSLILRADTAAIVGAALLASFLREAVRTTA